MGRKPTMNKAEEFDLEEVSPGVRDLVKELRAAGYETTDSGDGSNFKEGMECALPMRHVFGVVSPDQPLREFAKRLNALLPTLSCMPDVPNARVEVSYSPNDDTAVWCLFPDGRFLHAFGVDDEKEEA